VKTRNRFLPGEASLRERDGSPDEPSLRGQDAIVDLVPETRRAGRDSQRLELFLTEPWKVRGWLLVEDLGRRDAVVTVGNTAVLSPEKEIGPVLLELDLSLGREPHPDELVAQRLAELRLGDEQQVFGAATHHAHRRDYPCLGGQKERFARAAYLERRDFVREHALEVVHRIRAGDTHERPRADGDRGCHGSSVERAPRGALSIRRARAG
jgi:hypothetical protein